MSGLIPDNITVDGAPAAGVTPGAASAPPVVQAILSDANQVVHVKDDRGRSIGVRRTTALDMFDLSLLMGANAENVVALNQAMTIAAVTEIDGVPIERLTSEMALRAAIQRVGFEGMRAVNKALAAASVRNAANLEAAKN